MPQRRVWNAAYATSEWQCRLTGEYESSYLDRVGVFFFPFFSFLTCGRRR